MSWALVHNAATGGTAVVDADALPALAGRGWDLIAGPVEDRLELDDEELLAAAVPAPVIADAPAPAPRTPRRSRTTKES